MLSLVDKSWSELLSSPSPAWDAVNIDSDRDFDSVVTATIAAAVVQWFSRRTDCIRRLQIVGEAPTLPANLLATVLTLQSTYLRELYLVVGATQLTPADLGILTSLTALQWLTITLPAEGPTVSLWGGQGGAVMRAVSSLPALTYVRIQKDLSYNETESAVALPSLSTLASLQSPTISELSVYLNCAGGSICLGDLPALIECHIAITAVNCNALHVPVSAFESALSMAELAIVGDIFGDIRLTLDPTCLSSLSMLSVLKLWNCGLTHIPAALQGVRLSLRQLELIDNCLEINQAGLDILLSLDSIERIKIEIDTLSWTKASLQFLVVFLSSWNTLHPGCEQPDLMIV